MKYLHTDIWVSIFENQLSFEGAVNDTYLRVNRKLFTLRKIRLYISS